MNWKCRNCGASGASTGRATHGYAACVKELKSIVSLRNDELRAIRHTIVATVGGVDYEGFPTCELNWLQRLRILVEKEASLLSAQQKIEELEKERANELDRSVDLLRALYAVMYRSSIHLSGSGMIDLDAVVAPFIKKHWGCPNECCVGGFIPPGMHGCDICLGHRSEEQTQIG